MTNRVIIEKALQEWDGATVGCYDPAMDELSKYQIKRVSEDMIYGNTDIGILINRVPHIVEVFHVGKEVDFNIMLKIDYQNQYGND